MATDKNQKFSYICERKSRDASIDPISFSFCSNDCLVI